MCVRGERLFRARVLETEAYGGRDDPASHAFRGPTPRAAIMFGPAGFLYVYLSYGVHWCANVVTGAEGDASAVLFRSAEIVPSTTAHGVGSLEAKLLRGPGILTRGLGITGADNGLDCCARPEGRISFYTGPSRQSGQRVERSARIGLSRAQDRRSRYYLFPDIAK